MNDYSANVKQKLNSIGCPLIPGVSPSFFGVSPTFLRGLLDF